jgi:hypothetical protein
MKIQRSNTFLPMKIKVKIKVIVIIILLSTIQHVQATDVSSCQTISTDGGNYNLTQDITTTSLVCIIISGNNNTFNGNGHNMKSTNTFGAGLETTGNDNYIHNFSANNSKFSGIYDLNTFRNNFSDFYADFNGDGNFWQDISGTRILNADITHNNHSGSVAGDGDITLANTDINITFTNVNLTGTDRLIDIHDATFDVHNGGIGWQSTQSTPVHMYLRQVFSYTQDNITWHDNDWVPADVYSTSYNFSGLYPSRNYSIYQNQTLLFNLTTYSNGTLPLFTTVTTAPNDMMVLVIPTPTPIITTKIRNQIIWFG